jgi:hypothetical protein
MGGGKSQMHAGTPNGDSAVARVAVQCGCSRSAAPFIFKAKGRLGWQASREGRRRWEGEKAGRV